MPGFLILTPTILPDQTESGIVLPESAVVKSTSGICFATGKHPDGDADSLDKKFVGMEVFFSRHDEFRLTDSDTGLLLYILHSTKVIMWRPAPKEQEFFPVPIPMVTPLAPAIRFDHVAATTPAE